MIDKARKSLDKIFEDIEGTSIDLARADLDDYKIISQALDQAEKNEKILSLLKGKRIVLDVFTQIIKNHAKADIKVQLSLYNACVDSPWKLTETEFNLIKKLLEEEREEN